MEFSIKVYKEYFNFACSHFLIFEDGSREPLHGHNYRVKVKGDSPKLTADMVFDFLDIKPIVREVCDSLDHKVLIPGENLKLETQLTDTNINLKTPDGSTFSFPKQDVLILPIQNTSAERLAIFIGHEIKSIVKKRFDFQFSSLEIEVEETPGQSAVHLFKGDTL
ncbi:MAG: 6-carboxytetrahydropterin synthase [Bacteriovoracaceae bacterium]|nr:6-carboxytetrahydropterin synthase [Bacteriovoracaceae bacterium]